MPRIGSHLTKSHERTDEYDWSGARRLGRFRKFFSKIRCGSNIERLSSFTKDVLTLLTGTAFAQTLGILAMPILTRMFTAQAFGELAVFTSILGFVSIISTCRYHMAILLPKDDIEAANVLSMAVLAVCATSATTLLAVALCRRWIAAQLQVPTLEYYLWLMPLAVFIGGTFLCLSYWNTRAKLFRRLSGAQISGSFTTTGGKLLAGSLGLLSSFALILCSMVGSAVTTAMLAFWTLRDAGNVFTRTVSVKRIRDAATRYRKFPLINSWSAVLNKGSSLMPPILISAFFSPVAAGFYAIAHKAIKAPLALLSHSIGQVFFQRASKAQRDGELGLIFNSMLSRLCRISIMPFVILGLVGSDIFVIFFGHVWATAGLYAQILSLYMMSSFVCSPISTIYIVLERQGTAIIFDLAVFITRIGALVIGGIYENIIFALVLFSASGFVFHLGVITFVNRIAQGSILDVLLENLHYLIYVFATTIVLLFFKYVLVASGAWLIVISLVLLIPYFFTSTLGLAPRRFSTRTAPVESNLR